MFRKKWKLLKDTCTVMFLFFFLIILSDWHTSFERTFASVLIVLLYNR